MSHETVLKIKKASFQQGSKTIKANINGRAGPDDDQMPGGYVVGNDGLDLLVTVAKGWVIKTEIIIDKNNYQGLRIYTEKQ